MKIDGEELQNAPLLACVKKKSKHSFKKLTIALKVIITTLIAIIVIYFGIIVLYPFFASVSNGIYSAIIQVPIWILVPIIIATAIIGGVIMHSVLWCLWQRPSDNEWKRAQNSSFLVVISVIIIFVSLCLLCIGASFYQLPVLVIGGIGLLLIGICIFVNHDPLSFCLAYWMYRKRIKDTTYEAPVIINNP